MLRGLFEPMHLLIILVIVLLIFGPSRLGDIGKGLGKSIRDFKKAMSDDEKEETAQTPKEIPAAQSEAVFQKQGEGQKEKETA